MRRTGQRRSGGVRTCEILPSREFYDYEDKYELNLARTVVPPDYRRARSTISASWRSSVTKRLAAKAWGGWTFCARRRPANSTSTRSIRFRFHGDQHVSEDVGVRRSVLFRTDRPLIGLALERHAAKKSYAVHAIMVARPVR